MDNFGLVDKVKFAYHMMDILPDDGSWDDMSVHKECKKLTSTWCRFDLPVRTLCMTRNEDQLTMLLDHEVLGDDDLTLPRLQRLARKLLVDVFAIQSPSRAVGVRFLQSGDKIFGGGMVMDRAWYPSHFSTNL